MTTSPLAHSLQPVPPYLMQTHPRIDHAALVAVLSDLGGVEHLADLGAGGPLVASAGARSLFHCLFGRDSIRMAMDVLDDFPAVARATVRDLARLQGVRDNPRGEEEPGRILHEDRAADDPHAARLAEHWDLPYYGAVDSTPQWINLLAGLAERDGDGILDEAFVDRLGRTRTMHDALVEAIGWIVRRLDDPIGGGFLWVRRASPDGIINQVWEDSWDSYYHEDGALLDPDLPYAPVHVQGYVYDALLGAASIFERGSGGVAESARASEDAAKVRFHAAELREHAAELRARAARLRACVLAEFWLPELGTFAQALAFDAAGRATPIRVAASSPGHLLASGLLDGDDAGDIRRATIARFRQDDLLAAGGVRTKSTGAARFGAGTYHNGSTWPMDTGVIADGLRRHGEHAQADDLEDRILRGCAAVGGFPEFFRGDADDAVRVNTTVVDRIVDGRLNRLEQPPQADQGWTATRVWRILRRRGQI